ncbi:MAG TPA: hypothetical protein VHV32_15390 [Candidatus Angelobacter sp.]|jgi:hypothetical protein|nr:hypothetical protein [Candidatus Angelobacter sp.]
MSQTNPKTIPITIETTKNSSGKYSSANQTNSPGPGKSDFISLMTQPQFNDAVGLGIINIQFGE